MRLFINQEFEISIFLGFTSFVTFPTDIESSFHVELGKIKQTKKSMIWLSYGVKSKIPDLRSFFLTDTITASFYNTVKLAFINARTLKKISNPEFQISLHNSTKSPIFLSA